MTSALCNSVVKTEEEHGEHVIVDGLKFASTEHAFMAAKVQDKDKQKKIQRLSDAKDAKTFANSQSKRADWDTARFEVMEDVVRQKSQIPELKQILLATGNNHILEGNMGYGCSRWKADWP